MEYSNLIKTLAKDYQLQPQDIFFSLLCSLGTSRAETYAHIYRPKFQTASAITNGAANLVKEKPQIIKLIQDLKERNKIIPLTADLQVTKNQKKQQEKQAREEGWNDNETAQENLMRIIKRNIPKLEAKEKVDAARQLAKLLGVKEDTKETRHYYLPLSCKYCSLFIDAEDKKRKKEAKTG